MFGSPFTTPLRFANDLTRKLRHHRGARGSAISLATFLYSQAVRVLSSLILTRILAPEMFGLMAIVIAVQVTLGLISDVGLRTIVIQSHRGDRPEFLHTSFTFEIIRSIGVWLVCLVLCLAIYLGNTAGLFAPGTTLSDPQLPLVLAVASFSGVIYGFRSTKLLTAIREVRLGKVAAIDIIAQTLSVIFIIVLAVDYPSIWPLVFGGWVASLITTVLSHVWIERFPDQIGWDRETIKEFYTSGRWLLASSSIQALAINGDRFFLSALASPAFLGIYSLALSFILLVEVAGGKLITDVSYPSLCETARERRELFKRELERAKLQIDCGYLFASGAFYAAGSAIIWLLYDPRYHEAGRILQILSIGLFFHRYTLLPFAYMALGQPQLMAVVNAVRLVSLLCMASIGWWLLGLDGLLYGIALGMLPPALAILWLNQRFGLNNFKLELLVLPIWFVGYAAGWGGSAVIGFIAG